MADSARKACAAYAQTMYAHFDQDRIWPALANWYLSAILAVVRSIPTISKEPTIPKVFIRQVGAHFRVVYQRQYPNTVEEVVISTRFNTREEAQKFADAGLRAQRIYHNLTTRADVVPL